MAITAEGGFADPKAGTPALKPLGLNRVCAGAEVSGADIRRHEGIRETCLPGGLNRAEEVYVAGRAILRELQKRLERGVVAGAVHATLERLESQGFIRSLLGLGTLIRDGTSK